MLRLVTATAALLMLASSSASAQKPRAIHTGGAAGAYHTLFCPPLPPVLTEAQFPGYSCTACKDKEPCGSVANIERVMAEPTLIGFTQLDVLAREKTKRSDVAKKVSVVRQLACEGLFIVTKNQRITGYGDVLGLARRLPATVAAGGARATFDYMREVDPDGIGRLTDERIKSAATASAMIDDVAGSTDGRIGFFVQFADPENANIKKMMDSGLKVVPVLSRELLRAKVDGQEVYQLQEFTLKSGYTSYGTTTTRTACTPAVIVTGNPDSMEDRNARDNQKDMIAEVNRVPEAQLLPREGRVASLMRAIKRVSSQVAEEALAAVEAARKKTESSN